VLLHTGNQEDDRSTPSDPRGGDIFRRSDSGFVKSSHELRQHGNNPHQQGFSIRIALWHDEPLGDHSIETSSALDGRSSRVIEKPRTQSSWTLPVAFSGVQQSG
jgi:hypothetical protein